MGIKEGIQAMLLECMGLEPGEAVLIVVDPLSMEMGNAMWEVVESFQAEPLLIEMKERKEHGDEPPPAVAAAMRAAGVILAPTTKSLSHTRARLEACAAGARMASMPGITPGIITRSVAVDYDSMRSLTSKLAQMLTAAKTARLTSPLGTDLYFTLEGRHGIADTGDLSEPGAFGNLPAGEAFIAPLEGRCQGVFFCDGSVSGFGRVDEALRCEVKDGFVVSVDGDSIAPYLLENMEEAGQMSRNLAELGIGTNPYTPLSGNVLEDEKVFGTVHLGLGNNKTMGGEVDVPFHVDMVMKRPTLYLDDQEVIREGKFADFLLTPLPDTEDTET